MGAGILPVRPTDPSIFLAPSITIQTQVSLTDVSYYQLEINFVQMKESGISGTIIRAGQRNWADSRFLQNWARAKAAGLPRGSYWLYDSRETPERQAALWVSLFNGDYGELVLVADFEESYGGAYGTKAHFKKFLQDVERLSSLPRSRIVIYTAYYWWLERVGNDPFLKDYGLWLAWYNVMSAVRIPVPWEESDLLFWQYTDHGNGPLHGVGSGNVDLNWYCCSEENFRGRFLSGGNTGGGTGGTMTIYTGKAILDGAKVWNVVGGTVIRNLKLNEPIKGDAISGEYMHLTAPVNGWTKKAWLSYSIQTTPTDPNPPDPGGTPVPGTPSDVTVVFHFNDSNQLTGVDVDGQPWVKP